MSKKIEIPEGYEARIEGNKVILEPKSEDERIRKNIISWLKNIEGQTIPINEYDAALAYLERQKEQKPAEWSEEDEWKRNELLKYLEEKGDYRSTWYSWLKSLRPQPKENIEEKIDNFFDALGDCGYMQDEILRLKQLWKDAGLTTPQPKKQIPIVKVWKPSEEQMNALNSIILNSSFTYVGQVQDLISLKDELKKL